MIKFEHLRKEFILYLELLADLNRQNELWVETRPNHKDYADFDWIMHFILDDYSLDAEPPTRSVGGFLKDEDEATLAQSVALAILVVFEEIGRNRQPHEYINHPKWMKVVEAAQQALITIK